VAFVTPSFNILCNIWDYDADPLTDPPRIAGQACQLRPGVQSSWGGGGGYPPLVPTMLLLLPKLTDIRPGLLHVGGGSQSGDSVEVPAGSGRFYTVNQVDDTAKGFPNEHRFARVFQSSDPTLQWPFPIP